MRSKDGWRTVERTGVLYAFSDDGAAYTVLDAICPHSGCNVQWRDERNQFRCPCHDAWFSREGEVISGPPPRPLAQLETKIEEGRLLALL